MNRDVLNRIVIIPSLLLGASCFCIQLFRGSDLFYAAFAAACVTFASATVLLVGFRRVALMAMSYWQELQAQRQLGDGDGPADDSGRTRAAP